VPMPDEWMDRAVVEVLEDLDEERSRTRTGFNAGSGLAAQLGQAPGTHGESRERMRDPDPVHSRAEAADYGSIWRLLPALKDVPGELLRG
jgi:hypothetical protein